MKIAFVYNLKRSNAEEEAEFDTQEVIDSITAALQSKGDEVSQIEMTKDGEWINALAHGQPDIVFNTAEGFAGMGRESFAPTVFEQLNLNYVGSGPYATFITLDKFLTKKVVAAKGVEVPSGDFISQFEEAEILSKDLNYPVFVKPNFEGSSKGITQQSKCDTRKAFLNYTKDCLERFPQGLIVEQYVEGIDITVPYVTGLGKDGVLEPIEYTGTSRDGVTIYDYAMKNEDDENVGVLCPARIDDNTKKKVKKAMKKIVRALGINDMARADFRVTPSGELYFIEVNALPSLQVGAGIFAAAALEGLDYQQTIFKILDSGKKRHKLRGVRKSRTLSKKKPNVALVFNMKKKSPSEAGYEEEAEFDSPGTIKAIAEAIEGNGYSCHLIEADRDLANKLQAQEINVVFNIAEGINKSSREAQVPAICDLLDIEHTGSDASCLCLTLNKSIASKVVAAEGELVPRSALIHAGKKNYNLKLNYPLIVKPNLEGSSKGIYNDSVIENEKQLIGFLNKYFKGHKGELLVEEYIKGRELTVGLVGERSPRVVGVSEVIFKQGGEFPVYSYELKQVEDPLENEHFAVVSPPELTTNQKKNITSAAKNIFRATGCRDVARVDVRMNDKDEVYFIEVNPLPGLSPGFSDLPILAEKNGLSYEKLVGQILSPAVRRFRNKRKVL